MECSNCSALSDREYASQKYGSDENTFLPAAASALADVFDFDPLSSRKRILKRCTECGTYYLYVSDYVYLVNGSEDEELLTRLDEEETASLLGEVSERRGI